MFVKGHHRIGLFAKQKILQGEEILLDYDGLNILAGKFSWVEDNNKKMTGIKRKKKHFADIKTENENHLDNSKKIIRKRIKYRKL